MLFAQTSAPTGWTKSTSHNKKALRVVSGTGSGGNQTFNTIFASRNFILTRIQLRLVTFQWVTQQPVVVNYC